VALVVPVVVVHLVQAQLLLVELGIRQAHLLRAVTQLLLLRIKDFQEALELRQQTLQMVVVVVLLLQVAMV
jgi:hypothetical protein